MVCGGDFLTGNTKVSYPSSLVALDRCESVMGRQVGLGHEDWKLGESLVGIEESMLAKRIACLKSWGLRPERSSNATIFRVAVACERLS